jgi:hypothetical protein
MRWLYADAQLPEEREHIVTTAARIDAWWREFAGHTADLDAYFHQQTQWDLPGWMQEHLQGIHPSLMWEFGSAIDGPGHRLVITPESERWLRPLTSTILQRAPRIEGWEFYPYRVPEPVDWALAAVQGRTGVDISGATVEIRPGEHRRIALRFTFDACASPEDIDARRAAFVATESLVGEAVLDQWIGAIEVAPRKRSFLQRLRPAPRGLPLGELRTEVTARVDTLRAARPSRPCIEREDDPWSLWELKPTRSADDYAEQFDLLVGKSMDPDLWLTVRSGEPFYSETFSAHGETFCHVKIDGSGGLDEEHFADKGEIEDALDEPLRESRAGCFIGGGTGLRYSYIDLALLDTERGIDIVRDVLRAGNIHRRSWILFFDDTLSAEWIGIWPDTPPPPMKTES